MTQASPKFRWVKRIAIGLGSFFALLIVAALVIPLIVNIDQYRPQIVAIINDNINGKAEIGKLSLSLWGQVEIDIDGVKVMDSAGEKLISVDETYAQISFLSILAGRPHLVFRVVKPDITVIKDKYGKINLLSLVKPAAPEATAPGGAPPPPAGQPPAADGTTTAGGGDIPALALIAASGIDVELRDARLKFADLGSNFNQDVTGFNLVLKDISMTRPMQLKIWADIVTKAAATLKVTGPLAISGTVTPQFDGIAFKNVAVDLFCNFDDLDVAVGDVFRKPKGIPTNIKTNLNASAEFLHVQQLVVNFHNAVIEANAKVDKLQAASPVIDFNLKSKPIDLSQWGKLVTALKDLELEGRMDMEVHAQGPTDKLKYAAGLNIKDIVAKAPGLTAKPKMQLVIDVITDELKNLSFDFAAPGTDLNVKANIKSFATPKVMVAVNSGSIDLTQLLPPPPTASEPAKGADVAKEGAGQQGQGQGGAGAGGGGDAKTAQDKATNQPVKDVDTDLDSVRNNDFLKKLIANLVLRVKKFKGYNIEIKDIALDCSFKDLIAAIDQFQMDIFQGMIKANADVDLKPHSPLYKMNLNVAGIDLQSATESQMPSLRNTVLGKLSFKAAGNGKSLNGDQILKNLNLNGNVKIADAKFATVDAGKMISEGVNKSIGDLAVKIPPLKDKKVGDMKNFKSRYQSIGGDFTLAGGVFKCPNFETVSYPNEGIDIKGYTEADLINDKLKTEWAVVDTYNVSRARDVNVDVSGIKVDHVFAEGDKPVSFPVKAGCQLSAPCYDYASVPNHLGKIALENTRKAVSGKADAEIKKAKEKVERELAEQKRKAQDEADKQKKEAEEKAKQAAKDKAKEEGEKNKKKLLKGMGF